MRILASTWLPHIPLLRMQCPSLSLKTQFSLHRTDYQSVHVSGLASPIFSQSKQQQKHPSDSMAACIDTSLSDPNRPQNTDLKYNYVNFYRPNSSDAFSCLPISLNQPKTAHNRLAGDDFGKEDDGEDGGDLWVKMKEEAESDVKQEPILSGYYHGSILSQTSLESALANHLSIKLSNSSLPSSTLLDLFRGVLSENQEIMTAVEADLRAVKQRDPACVSYVHCFLNFKGFLAIQAHRVAHRLWSESRKILALLIQNRVSEVFAVDIHPGAKIGRGILLDHATGFVVGETAVIGNNVSILHNVTLGGTGKASGDRHPKIGDGVLIGAGTCILGNIRVGDGAKIGAGSVVLKEVPARTTAVGNPARLIGGKENPVKLDKTPSFTMDHTSHISEWSDYVI